MDYETADGSQFSLRETWSEGSDIPEFQGTLITAFVDGNAYAGKSPQKMDEMDDADVLQYLEAVPVENIFPLLPEGFTIAPPFDASKHYLKAPQFAYEDRLPGETFVAECMMHEAATLELLMKQPHPSIVTYHGCVVREKRITHLCLKRCHCSLAEYREMGLSVVQKQTLMEQVHDGIKHLHSLGLAHNDITPENVCADANGHAVIVDFDSCVPLGEPLMKGVAQVSKGDIPLSDAENDRRGLELIESFLLESPQGPRDEISD